MKLVNEISKFKGLNGIEKVLKKIITNSSIRYLILCGDESGNEKMGHLSGQAIAGSDAASIYYTVIKNSFVSKLDHALTWVKRITMAENSLKHDIPYHQDKAYRRIRN